MLNFGGFESQNSSLNIKLLHSLVSYAFLPFLLQQLPMWSPHFQPLCPSSRVPKSSCVTLRLIFLRPSFSRVFLVAYGLRSESSHLVSRALCSLATNCLCFFPSPVPWCELCSSLCTRSAFPVQGLCSSTFLPLHVLSSHSLPPKPLNSEAHIFTIQSAPFGSKSLHSLAQWPFLVFTSCLFKEGLNSFMSGHGILHSI